MIIGVLVELSSKNIDKIFDYKVPVQLEDKIKIIESMNTEQFSRFLDLDISYSYKPDIDVDFVFNR